MRILGLALNSRPKTISTRAMALSILVARRMTSETGTPVSTRTSARSVRTVDSGMVVSRRALVPTGMFTQKFGMSPVVGAQEEPSFALASRWKTTARARSASAPAPAIFRRFFIARPRFGNPANSLESGGFASPPRDGFAVSLGSASTFRSWPAVNVVSGGSSARGESVPTDAVLGPLRLQGSPEPGQGRRGEDQAAEREQGRLDRCGAVFRDDEVLAGREREGDVARRGHEGGDLSAVHGDMPVRVI